MRIEHPQDVINALADLRAQSEQGVKVLAEAEQKQIRLELEAERIEFHSFLQASGPIAERNAIAKLRSLEAREAAELARIEVTRIKTKLKQLSESMMSVQTSARMVELQWKTAGVGER